MTSGEFEKNSWGWQLSQLQQQAGEWIELQLSRFGSNVPNLPKWSLPRWLVDLTGAIAWLILGLVLVWVFWQLWRLLEPYLYSFISPTASTTKVTTLATQLSPEAWFARSQTYFRAGNYRLACRCLYMAMLQRLHDSAIAPHQSSRTDGEYLQLVNSLPQSQSYQTLIATHEQLCFGNAQILPETYDACQQAYREIDISSYSKNTPTRQQGE